MTRRHPALGFIDLGCPRCSCTQLMKSRTWWSWNLRAEIAPVFKSWDRRKVGAKKEGLSTVRKLDRIGDLFSMFFRLAERWYSSTFAPTALRRISLCQCANLRVLGSRFAGLPTLVRSHVMRAKVGGEGGIRIYTRSLIPNDLNGSGPREAIETTELLDGRT